MTATVAKIPDPLVVLRRAEQKHTGEEPGDLDHLAEAVRVQIITPLTAGGVKVAPRPAGDGQAKALVEDNARLEEIVAELRRQIDVGDKAMQKLAREVANLKEQNGAQEKLLAEAEEDTKRRIDAAVGAIQTATGAMGGKVDELREQLTAKQHEIDEARAARDIATAQLREQGSAPGGALEQAQADNARIVEQLAAATRDLTAANRTLDEIADEQAEAPAHTHRWPIPEPGGDAQPCECGMQFLRYAAAYEVEEEEVSEVEPWSAFFDRIRYELHEEWPR